MRLLLFVGFILIFFIGGCWYDLTVGTLNVHSIRQEGDVPDYFIHRVTSGDTYIKILENSLNGPIPVSLDRALRDFKRLNQGKDAFLLKIFHWYRFPDYSEHVKN